MTPELISKAIAAFDAANSMDPNKEQGHPKELLYGQRMSKTLASFELNPSPHLQLAARAQHIERWKSPRTDFPEGRAGYKKWRSQLSLFHAARAGDILHGLGFNQDDINRVKFLIQKRHLKRDPETQTLEDVICLVFLKHYFVDFTRKHSEEKLIDIVQKTWVKMSDRGQKTALSLTFPEKISVILKKSLC